jgi:c-di-GMP-binding flagellar brake protein YcgR
MVEEKRKFLRFECLVPVDHIKIEGKNRKAKKAALFDISREGLRLTLDLDFSFNRGNDVDFKVNIPEKKISSTVTGEVIWSKPKGKKLELGLKIKNMDKAAKSELLDLGYSRWREMQTSTKGKKKA